MVIIR